MRGWRASLVGVAIVLLSASPAWAQADAWTQAHQRLEAAKAPLLEQGLVLYNSGSDLTFLAANHGGRGVLVIACADECRGITAVLHAHDGVRTRSTTTDDPRLLVVEASPELTSALSNWRVRIETQCRRRALCQLRWALLGAATPPSLQERGVPAPPTEAEWAAAANLTTQGSIAYRVLPNAAMLEMFYPPHALMRGQEGSALLDCLVQAQGRLRCGLNNERPPLQGFGDAALRLATQIRVEERDSAGAPVEGLRVRLPIQFRTD